MKQRYQFSVVRRLAKYSHPLIKKIEKHKTKKFSDLSEKKPLIFIVGAPRTGSTILYQLMTHYFHVLYINNFICAFYQDIFVGFWLSRLLFPDTPHNCFNSSLGNTFQCGFKGPAECGNFWYRWLPREKHFIEKNDIDKKKQQEISQILSSIINRYNLPLVIKNLNAGQRMRLIHQVNPNAKFILIKRDPLYTAQSIWLSKHHIGLKPNQWWSIMPKNYDDLVKLTAHKQIVRQIFFLEKQILTDRSLFPEENFIVIQYENLCQNPKDTLLRLKKFIGSEVEIRKDALIPPLKLNDTPKINEEDFSLLKKEIKKLDWDNLQI